MYFVIIYKLYFMLNINKTRYVRTTSNLIWQCIAYVNWKQIMIGAQYLNIIRGQKYSTYHKKTFVEDSNAQIII